MNNFKLALNHTWNKYYALNEFLGAALLIILIIVFFYIVRKNMKNKWIIAPIIGVIFLLVVMITTVVGHLYGGSSNSLSFLNPISVILNGVIRNLYAGMAYLIGFEVLGTFTGGLIAIGVIKGLGGSLKDFSKYIEFDNSKLYKSLTKEILMNTILCLSIICIPLFAWMNSTLDATMSYIVLSSTITVLLLVTTNTGYFMFMFPLSIVLLIIKSIFGKIQRAELLNLLCAFVVHIIIPFLVGAVLYKMINSGKIYFHLS